MIEPGQQRDFAHDLAVVQRLARVQLDALDCVEPFVQPVFHLMLIIVNKKKNK